MKKNYITLIVAIFILEIIIGYIIWTRYEIANFDVVQEHCQMTTKYCPYCGELLEK